METKKLRISKIKQETSNLCWATSIQMVLKFKKTTPLPSQREIASFYAQGRNENDFPLPTLHKLDVTFVSEILDSMNIIKNILLHYSIDSIILHKDNFNEVINSIKNEKPVIAFVKNGNLAGHVVIAKGFKINRNSGLRKIVINDPGVINVDGLLSAKEIEIEIENDGMFKGSYNILSYLKIL